MAEALSRSLRELPVLFRALNPEQRVAAVGAVLLLVSTFGPFSFVEAAEVLTALGVLALLRARARGRRFHLPLGDGTAIAAAGLWAALLIVVRLFDRPLGQNLLALACCAILALAGLRERAKRPADDLPPDAGPSPGERFRGDLLQDVERRPAAATAVARRRGAPAAPDSEDVTEPLPPPELEPDVEPGEQLSLTGDEEGAEEVSSPAESPGGSESESPGRNGA